jgi:hypothetical protein
LALDLQPIALLDATSLAPLPVRPSFSGIVADGLSNAAGLDAALASASTDLANAGSDPSDGFDAAVADATSDGLEAPGADVAGTSAALLDHGDSLDQVRQSVSDGLPPPETPVSIDNVDPPPKPDRWPMGPKNTENPPVDVLS